MPPQLRSRTTSFFPALDAWLYGRAPYFSDAPAPHGPLDRPGAAWRRRPLASASGAQVRARSPAVGQSQERNSELGLTRNSGRVPNPKMQERLTPTIQPPSRTS